MYTRLLETNQMSHTQSMIAKRGLTNQANVHKRSYPYVQKVVLTARRARKQKHLTLCFVIKS